MDHWNKNDRIIEINTHLNEPKNEIRVKLVNQKALKTFNKNKSIN